MASITFQITSYQVYLGSKLLMGYAAGTQPAPVQAYIRCIGKQSEQFDLFFINKDRNVNDTDSDQYPNQSNITNKTAKMFVPSTQYTWYIDLLRNEDRVWATIDGSLPKNNRIWCAEAVGEGDLKDLIS